jgi:hypothetical protein
MPECPAMYKCIAIYSHTGQHGEAAIGFYYNCTVKATEAEYSALLAEMTEIYSRDYGEKCPPMQIVVKQRLNYSDLIEKAWKRFM